MSTTTPFNDSSATCSSNSHSKLFPPLSAWKRPPSSASAVSTSFAGKIWPVLLKFRIGPAKAAAIARNIVATTHWQDIVLLSVLAFGCAPLAQFSHFYGNGGGASTSSSSGSGSGGSASSNSAYANHASDKSFLNSRRYKFSQFVSGAAKVALSSYVVDIVCVSLSTIGFTFPHRWDLPDVYIKTAYILWGLQQLLAFKRKALCQFYKIPNEDNMGRIGVLDRFINAFAVTIVSLLLLDWLSIEFGMAFKGLFAFGSVGTLAFTLASQDLVSQFLAGLFLNISNKANVNDYVKFGDGTEGVVMKMGWMESVLRGGDNTLTTIPNSKLASQKISNVSRVQNCQIKQTLRFHYEDAEEIPKLLDSIRAEIKASCGRLILDGSRPFRVFWTNYNQDHLEVMVDTHHMIAPIGDPYFHTRQKVLEAIHRAVKKHNMSFAPQYMFAMTAAVAPPSMRTAVFPLPKESSEMNGDSTVNGDSTINDGSPNNAHVMRTERK